MVASFIPSILDELDDVVISSPASGQVIRYNGTNFVNAQLAHADLSGIGVNTHTQIDTHIASTSNPHGTTMTQTNLNITGVLDIANTAPYLTLTDTTASAKSLKIDVDANIAQIRELLGASGSLLTLDLVNNLIGIGTASPTKKVEISISHIGSLLEGIRVSYIADITKNAGFGLDARGAQWKVGLFFNGVSVFTVADNTGVCIGSGFMTANVPANSLLVENMIGVGTITPASTALLDLTSVSKGFLLPRMTTTQRNAISSPATGLEIYNMDYNKKEFYNGLKWITQATGRTYASDMASTTTSGHMWILGGALVSGTSPAGAATENYPHFFNLTSAATQTANTGWIMRTASNSMILSAGQYTEMIFKVQLTTDSNVYFGFINLATATPPTKGSFIKIINGVVYGENIEASTSTTGALATLTAGTWYKAKLWVNNAKDTVTFQLLDANDAIINTQSLTANIPTSGVHHGLLAYELGAAAPDQSVGGVLISLDYMRLDL